MTFSTIQAWCIRPRRDVATILKEFQRLAVTLPAHLQGCLGISFSDEIAGVSFDLVGLRRVTAVTTIAADTGDFVHRGLIYGDHLAGLVFLTAMTVYAGILSLNIGGAGIAQQPHAHNEHPHSKYKIGHIGLIGPIWPIRFDCSNHLIPTTIESGPSRFSTLISRKPAARIQSEQ